MKQLPHSSHTTPLAHIHKHTHPPTHPVTITGYGFSSAPRERGFGVTAIAATMDSLMASLGYKHYVAQVGECLRDETHMGVCVFGCAGGGTHNELWGPGRRPFMCVSCLNLC